MSSGDERLEPSSGPGLLIFLSMGLLLMFGESIANVILFDFWPLPLSLYFVFVFTVLLRKKVWQWRPAAASFTTWLAKPQALAVIAIGLACLALETVGDVRRRGAVRALVPMFSVVILFAVCYLLSIPVTWIILRYRRNR